MTLTRLIALTACAALLAACESGTVWNDPAYSPEIVDPMSVGAVTPPAAYEETLAASCQRDDLQADALIEAVNAARRAEGKTILKVDNKLNLIAQGHACDMAAAGRVTVAGSDGSSVVNRARAAHYPPCGVIQIVWRGGSATEAVAAGMRSDPHREQLLGQFSDDIGAGVTTGPDGRNWWSLVIGDNCIGPIPDRSGQPYPAAPYARGE